MYVTVRVVLSFRSGYITPKRYNGAGSSITEYGDFSLPRIQVRAGNAKVGSPHHL
jgi:hypothetical protein